ncbi:uncharacterized protein LOC129294150 isoform X1 [Prosopis cineraria]|uniref:uncharacterized protein LOC129294150 isoform X1 n=1 Tax=Prosopis cineraria TaxID=364024 RepID=UPI002410399B|nr:uncharacterized protein LOC129294150 isoform X1 [Prosopis cineraria]
MTTKPKPECCMCGDCGFPEELFQCKVCQFRSQHRYCSNLYPRVDAYETCNWCLVQKDDVKEKSLNSSNSSSSFKNNGSTGDESKNKRIKNSNVNSPKIGGKKGEAHAKNKGIQKRKSPEARSPSPPSSVLISPRKRIVTDGGLEERLRRTKSEDISNTSRIITRQVFRNKVRRYKLLDEVSS